MTYRARRNLSFPLFLLLLTTLHSLPAVAAPAAQTARKQIYNQVVAAASADIRRVAAQKKWADYSSKLTVFIPGDASSFSRCSTPLRTAAPGGDRLDLARLRYDIRCEDAEGWTVAVTVKPDIYMQVLVAKQALPRGTLLAASDVELKKRNVVGLRNGFIVSPDDAVGFTVKRRLRDLQPIGLADLEQPIMVERGQRVIVIAAQDGIEAKVIGEALKKGRKGDMINVRNLNSQRTVSAIVDGPGVVRTRMAASAN